MKSLPKEFKVNEFISLKLEENNTVIYVKDEPLEIHTFLMFNIDYKYLRELESVKVLETVSLDGVIEKLGWIPAGLGSHFNPEPAHQHCVGEGYDVTYDISPETEFWGFCSNLQVWAEHDYDTNLLHTQIAFPILKKLVEYSDPIAIRAFNREILKQFQTGTLEALEFLCGGYENYFHKFLDADDTVRLLLALKTQLHNINHITGVYHFYAELLEKAKRSPLFEVHFNEILEYCLVEGYLAALIREIKDTDLFKEKLSTIIKSFEKMGYGYTVIDYDDFISPFKTLIETIKGTKFIEEHFDEILRILEMRFDYLRGIFLIFIEGLKVGKILESKFPDLLIFLKKADVYEFYLDLIKGIKNTELFDIYFDQIIDFVDPAKIIYYDFIEFIGVEYFSEIITQIKGTEIIKKHYPKIREKFLLVLSGIKEVLKELLKEYDEIYGEDIGFFYNLISAIKGTRLLGEFFPDILNLFDDFYAHEELDASKLFTKFSHIILEDPAFESNFRDILSSLEKMPNYYKKKATSKLIELIKGTDLLKEYFPNFAYLNENIDPKYNNINNFTTYFDTINRIEGGDTTLIEILGSQIFQLIENSFESDEGVFNLPDFLSRLNILNNNHLKMKILSKVFERIKNTNLMKTNLLEILNFLEKIDATYKKKVFYNFLDEINKKGLLKKHINTILRGINFHNYPEFFFELNEFLSIFYDADWEWDYFREMDKFSVGLEIPYHLNPRFNNTNDEINFYFFAKLFYLAKDTSIMEELFIYILENYEKLEGIEDKVYNFSDFTWFISNSTFMTKYLDLIEHTFLEILNSLKEVDIEEEFKQHLLSTFIENAKRTSLLERNSAFIVEKFPELSDKI